MSADHSPLPPPPVPGTAVRQSGPPRRSVWPFLLLGASVLLNLFLFLALIGVIGSIGAGSSASRHDAPRLLESHISGPSRSEDRVAVIHIRGIISSQGEDYGTADGMVGYVKHQLDTALKDDSVKAVILRIDSPGGEVLASDRIYHMVRKARDKKPVVCLMGSICASGGFYAAMGSEWIIADPLTITGSIGVIMQTLNYEGLFNKVGLRSLVFKSGRFKDLLNGDRQPTEEEMKIVQDLVMETYDTFFHVVLTERNRKGEVISADTLRDSLADGRIFSGKQALAARLVDQNGTFEDAVAKAGQLAKIQDPQVFEYRQPFTFGDFFRLFGQSQRRGVQVNVLPENALRLEPGKIYLISNHLF